MRNWECGMKKEERVWNAECGMRNVERKKEEREAQECGMRNLERKKEEKEQKTDGTGGARIVWHLITLVVYQEGVI